MVAAALIIALISIGTSYYAISSVDSVNASLSAQNAELRNEMNAVAKASSGLNVTNLLYMQNLTQAAAQEGKVVVCTALLTATINALAQTWKQTYPNIDFQISFISSPLLSAKVLTEHQAGKPTCDVIVNDLGYMTPLKSEGVLAQYKPLNAQLYPSSEIIDSSYYIDPPVNIWLWGFIYNSHLVNSTQAPKTLGDLLNNTAQWAGKYVMPDPSKHAGTAEWLLGYKDYYQMSNASFSSFLSQFMALNPRLVSSGTPSAAAVINGEDLVGFTTLQQIPEDAPAPLGYIPLSPIIATANCAGLIAGAPDPAAAKLAIEFLLSPTAAKTIASAGDMPGLTQYPAAVPGISRLTIQIAKPYPPNQITAWQAYFANIFG